MVAEVTAEPRLVMDWNGRKIVDLSRVFLNSNGATKYTDIEIEEPGPFDPDICGGTIKTDLGIEVCQVF